MKLNYVELECFVKNGEHSEYILNFFRRKVVDWRWWQRKAVLTNSFSGCRNQEYCRDRRHKIEACPTVHVRRPRINNVLKNSKSIVPSNKMEWLDNTNGKFITRLLLNSNNHNNLKPSKEEKNHEIETNILTAKIMVEQFINRRICLILNDREKRKDELGDR